MAERFPAILPMEIAFTRRVSTAAEVVDGVTLAPVRRGIRVSATGLARAPLINSGGLYVWLAEDGRAASEIVVDPLDSGYEPGRAAPAALPDHARIELAPGARYRFPAEATALRGRLLESSLSPSAPVSGALVWLQWADDAGWIDAPLASRSNADGDFAAALRLGPKDEARTRADGALAVRLVVERGASVRMSGELPLRQGRVVAAATPFLWTELAP